MPVDNDYALALGRAVHAFARLEWSVVWIIERLQPGYIFVQKRATAGIIKNDLKGSIDSNSYLGSYPQLHTDLMTICVNDTPNCTTFDIQKCTTLRRMFNMARTTKPSSYVQSEYVLYSKNPA